MAAFPYNRKTLQRIAPQIAHLQRNSLRMQPHPLSATALPRGISKCGGIPDLPPIMSWPRGTLQIPEPTPLFKATYPEYPYLPSDGTFSLPFLAQIQLDTAHPYDTEGLLPATGILYFFVNYIGYPSDTGPLPHVLDHLRHFTYGYYGDGIAERLRVVYIDGDPSILTPRPTPRDIPTRATYGAQQLTFAHEWTTPALPSCFITDAAYDIPASVRLRSREATVYNNWHYQHRTEPPVHQMLGHADDIQEFGMERSYRAIRGRLFPELPPVAEMSVAEQHQEYIQCRLLLQVSELDNGMYFGRNGRLFIYIRETDLRRRDFSKVWIETH